MDERAIHEILSGRRRGLTAATLRGGLLIASLPYCAAMRLRRWAYRRQLPGLFSRRPACASRVPIICVGNITTGGTGKTPVVAMIVRHLASLGRKPAILTRGYKARGGVSDEARLLGLLTQGRQAVSIVADPDRVAGAQSAVTQGADVLVMDDGFQHRRLGRDLDIVLIDALNPFGYGHCLPRGLLREPLSAINDAGVIVITHADQAGDEKVESLRQELSRLAPQARLCQASHVPTALLDEKGLSMPAQELAGKKVFAFCGLGNPESFFSMASRLGADLVGTRAFEDHAAYDAAAIEALCRQAAGAGAERLLTTQKDFVKLGQLPRSMPIWQLAIDVEITSGKQVFFDAVAEVL